MTDQGKLVTELPVKTAFANKNSDRILYIHNAANTTTAQTSSITVDNFNLHTLISNPANSTSFSCTQGQLFFSNTHLYFAVANNTLKRVALTSF